MVRSQLNSISMNPCRMSPKATTNTEPFFACISVFFSLFYFFFNAPIHKISARKKILSESGKSAGSCSRIDSISSEITIFFLPLLLGRQQCTTDMHASLYIIFIFSPSSLWALLIASFGTSAVWGTHIAASQHRSIATSTRFAFYICRREREKREISIICALCVSTGLYVIFACTFIVFYLRAAKSRLLKWHASAWR